jgi:hypothetical protein
MPLPSYGTLVWIMPLYHVSNSLHLMVIKDQQIQNLLIVFLVILENKHIYLLIKVSLCLLHHLIWFIMIFGALPLFPLRGSLIIFLFLLMIILIILGYIYYNIALNSLKFIKNFVKWYKPNFLIPSKFFVQIMLWNIMRNLFKFFLKQNGTLCHRSCSYTSQQNGTLSHCSCSYTSQQNGHAERKHRHILDTERALLISASLPKRFWGEAALTTVYTINRAPSSTIHNQTPYERLYGSTPNYSLLCIFGCICFVTLPPHEDTKLEPRSRLCCFLSYGITQKGYHSLVKCIFRIASLHILLSLLTPPLSYFLDHLQITQAYWTNLLWLLLICLTLLWILLLHHILPSLLMNLVALGKIANCPSP